MKVLELIKALQAMPPDAEVGYIYDGALRGDIEVVWLTRYGVVATADYDEVVYHDDDRPAEAPSSTEEPYWRSKPILEQKESDCHDPA